MLQNLTGWHALIILAVVVLIFGASRLPALAKGLGQSVRILKTEVVDPRDDGSAKHEQATAATVPPRSLTTPEASSEPTTATLTTAGTDSRAGAPLDRFDQRAS